jgi:CRP/FNR family transcriptional regulator
VVSGTQEVCLFAEAGPEAQRQLEAVAVSRTYDSGQTIFLEGDLRSPVCFVLEGTVRIFRTNPDGREQTLIRVGPGEAFNLPAAFVDPAVSTGVRSTPASAAAVGPVRLLSVSRSDFRRLASHTPEIALAVLRDFAQKLYHFTGLTYDLSLRSVRGRLARFLLTQVQEQSDAPVRWTQEEIAARIGTVREVVSRTMRALIRDGLIKMERHRVVVLDRDALAREAES